MTAFMQYLAIEARKLTYIETQEVIDRLSNWSYLHLSFKDQEPTKAELEAMMYLEMQNKNRAHILYRLYARWQKAIKEEHYREMNI